MRTQRADPSVVRRILGSEANVERNLNVSAETTKTPLDDASQGRRLFSA
jgi:hypothetical protein